MELDFNIISVCKNMVIVMFKEDISGLVWHKRKSVTILVQVCHVKCYPHLICGSCDEIFWKIKKT